MCFLTAFVDHRNVTFLWILTIIVTSHGIRDVLMLLLVPKKDRKHVLRLEKSISIK